MAGAGYKDLLSLLLRWLSKPSIIVPTVPGVEYTLSVNRPHYTLAANRPHYTLAANRPHYTLPSDDL